MRPLVYKLVLHGTITTRRYTYTYIYIYESTDAEKTTRQIDAILKKKTVSENYVKEFGIGVLLVSPPLFPSLVLSLLHFSFDV